MNAKDLLNQFRAAAWASPEEADRFVAEAAGLGAGEVEKLLELAGARAGTPQQQRRRLFVFEQVASEVSDKALFAAYVRALRSADPGLREVLVRLLPGVNNVAEHGNLVALLWQADARLRRLVAEVLPHVGGRTAFEMLCELARDPAFPGRSDAIAAAMAIAPQHALPLLRTVLSVGNDAEKLEALSALEDPRPGARDPGSLVAALAAALADPSETVALRAVQVLAAMGSEDAYFEHAVPLLEGRSAALSKAAVDGLRAYPSPRTVAALHARVRPGPSVVRLAALDALEAIGTNDVLDPLAEALGHAQLAVRMRAGEALLNLGRAGKLDLARTVIWLLRSRDVNVRRMAVELAQTVEDPDGELWPKLLGHLRDEDWWVRERVMDALTEMAGERLVRHLVSFLNDPSDLLRRCGVDALRRLKSSAALGNLVKTARGDPDWWVRERAIEALGAIGDSRAIPHLVHLMLNTQFQVACLAALAELAATSSAPQVASLLGSDDGDVQLAALRCLKEIGGPREAAEVQPLTRHARIEVRSLANELITRWGESIGSAPAVQQAIPVLDQLLIAVARAEGDDLILAPGRRPLLKRLGRTEPLAASVVSAEKMRALLAPHLQLEHLERLNAGHEVDFSYRVETEDLRFRANVFRQLAGLGAVFRIIKSELPDLQKLGLPAVVHGLTEHRSGLVLVGGATGSGKSTTLAAMVDRINRRSRRHIVTLEDPIEVVHARKQSLISQREVDTHMASFSDALRATLRQDPDVILVGELRDLPTISFAVTAAETGHLVFGTIHTVSAAGSIDRLVNSFPANQEDHVRGMLASSLRAVICQYLIPRADGPGRCLAVEVMVNSDAVANLIRKGKTFQIPSVIATSREEGMQLMDVELLRMTREGRISAPEAHARAVSKKDFEALLQGVEAPGTGAS